MVVKLERKTSKCNKQRDNPDVREKHLDEESDPNHTSTPSSTAEFFKEKGKDTILATTLSAYRTPTAATPEFWTRTFGIAPCVGISKNRKCGTVSSGEAGLRECHDSPPTFGFNIRSTNRASNLRQELHHLDQPLLMVPTRTCS
jgi:hypothetical protein